MQFFKDVYSACPEIPLVHYNIWRAKRFLGATDYLRILEVAPTVIGVKYTFAGSHFGDLQDALLKTPQLSYFVAENLLASGMMLGARGCCSSLVFTDPSYMLTYYDHASSGRWEDAIRTQQEIHRFFGEAAAFIQKRGEGLMDPIFDKGLAVASGCVLGSQRTREPYIGWTDETVAAMRAWLRTHYPQFLHPDIRVTSQ